MSNDYTIIFNDLFAFRVEYQDYIHEEYIIINKLKNKLIDFGVDETELNNILFNFYNYFNIPITMSQIENVPIHSPYSLHYQYNNHDNNHNDSDDNHDDDDIFSGIDTEPTYFNTIIYTPLGGPINNLLNLLFSNTEDNYYNQGNYNNQDNLDNQDNLYYYEDIIVTTDTNSLNSLPIYKITNDMQLLCSICQEEMNEGDEYLDIECKHIFHRNCLTTYLENYNHICPTCRKEIGTPHFHT
jgi:hypothetical protein